AAAAHLTRFAGAAVERAVAAVADDAAVELGRAPGRRLAGRGALGAEIRAAGAVRDGAAGHDGPGVLLRHRRTEPPVALEDGAAAVRDRRTDGVLGRAGRRHTARHDSLPAGADLVTLTAAVELTAATVREGAAGVVVRALERRAARGLGLVSDASA